MGCLLHEDFAYCIRVDAISIAVDVTVFNTNAVPDLHAVQAFLLNALVRSIVKSDRDLVDIARGHPVALLNLVANDGASNNTHNRSDVLARAAAHLIAEDATHDTTDHCTDTRAGGPVGCDDLNRLNKTKARLITGLAGWVVRRTGLLWRATAGGEKNCRSHCDRSRDKSFVHGISCSLFQSCNARLLLTDRFVSTPTHAVAKCGEFIVGTRYAWALLRENADAFLCENDLHAAVHLATSGGIVAGNGIAFTEGLGAQSHGWHTLAHERRHDGVGATAR